MNNINIIMKTIYLKAKHLILQNLKSLNMLYLRVSLLYSPINLIYLLLIFFLFFLDKNGEVSWITSIESVIQVKIPVLLRWVGKCAMFYLILVQIKRYWQKLKNLESQKSSLQNLQILFFYIMRIVIVLLAVKVVNYTFILLLCYPTIDFISCVKSESVKFKPSLKIFNLNEENAGIPEVVEDGSKNHYFVDYTKIETFEAALDRAANAQSLDWTRIETWEEVFYQRYLRDKALFEKRRGKLVTSIAEVLVEYAEAPETRTPEELLQFEKNEEKRQWVENLFLSCCFLTFSAALFAPMWAMGIPIISPDAFWILSLTLFGTGFICQSKRVEIIHYEIIGDEPPFTYKIIPAPPDCPCYECEAMRNFVV